MSMNNNKPLLPIMDFACNPLNGSAFTPNYWKLYDARKQLPIWEHKEQFMQLMDQPNVQFILLEAETGSGKTTQIPQWCLEWLRKTHPQPQSQSPKMVCCTQPRRLATQTVARRVAQEMDVKLGQEVGYSMRFEEAASSLTVLKYCTDGVLLAEATRNNRLGQYGVIILDEVHERSLTMDVLMGLVKEIAAARPELRVVVMSATLEAGNFRNYFNERSAELKLPGRSYPVTVSWSDSSPTADNYRELAVAKVKWVHQKEQRIPGDILLFLTGEEDIEAVCEELNRSPFATPLRCLPLYSTLGNDKQQLIFEQLPLFPEPGMPFGRRCIVATNIAETSMTIEGIVFVIDPGFCKRIQFDTKTRIESLLVQPITQASAIQRAGRAGRTRPGKCFRLFSEDDFKKMKPVDPEIRHSNLANVVLHLKKFGIKDLQSFDFMDAPPPQLLTQAIESLTYQEAFDENGELTALGSKMASFPVDPPLARMLIESIKLQCSREVIAITAMISAQNCFFRPKKQEPQADKKKAKFIHDQGDHLTLLRVLNAYTETPKNARSEWCEAHFLNNRALQYATKLSAQLEGLMRRQIKDEITSANPNLPSAVFNIAKALVSGSFMKVAFFKPSKMPGAKKGQGHYVTVESVIGEKAALLTGDGSANKNVPEYHIHPSSVLAKRQPEWILYEQAIQLDGKKHYLRTVSAIRSVWLMELAPTYYGQLRAIKAELQRLAKTKEARKPLLELVTTMMNALQLKRKG